MVRTIRQKAFGKVESLRSVILNEGLEVLGTDEYPDTGKVYSGVFENCSIERVELPSTLKRIESGTFMGCKNLKVINLPDKLEYIGCSAF